MSRIQDILAKADREGTAGLLQPTPLMRSGSSAAAPAVVTSISHGTAALPSTLQPMTFPLPAADEPVAVEPRTAQPRLHQALVAAIAPHSTIAEQYRGIRAKLTLREEAGTLRTLAITSPARGDGKTLTAANLALTMAQEVQRAVVLVDADFRNPAVHTLFAVEGQPGLAEVLAGDASLDEALVYLPELRLTLLPAGHAPAYPTETLGSAAMRLTLDALATRFDRVLLDLPPAQPLADVGTVTPLVDGVVMVVRAGVTQRPVLDQVLATFEPHKVVGMVLNDKD